jgi:hypothetical protein
METIPATKQFNIDLPVPLIKLLRLEAVKRDTTMRELMAECITAHLGEPATEAVAQ